MSGTWTALSTQPNFNADVMLLLTDGTVMCHELDSNHWHKLIPDSSGSTPPDQAYIKGSWSTIADFKDNPNIPSSQGGPKNMPRFFASAVLADGTVFTAGGEYNNIAVTGNNASDTLAVEIYDPVGDAWTNIDPPTGWTGIGDAPSCVLPDGRVLLGNSFSATNQVGIFDPATQLWESAANKLDSCSEEGFTLLPDRTVLTVQCGSTSIPGAEKYVIDKDKWVAAGSTPTTLPQACPGIVAELGPAVLLPSGKVFAIGATGDTAIYTPPAKPADPGSWTQGPTLKVKIGSTTQTMFPIDAPAALLPNGKVLCVGSPSPPCNFPGPTNFFEYDPSTDKATAITTNSSGGTMTPPNAGNPCFLGRFLLLPSGQVLFAGGTQDIEVYTPDGGPKAAWKPKITNSPADMVLGHTYTITGTQFNGLSQACTYGDDQQMATNYPLVRITDTATNDRTYLRTFNHSTMAVATGNASVTTNVTVPLGTPIGQYELVVVANGIASDPVTVKIAARDCFFTLDRSTFAQGEIEALINLSGAPATIDPAVYVVVEGFSAADLGLTSSNLSNPPHKPSIPDPVGKVSLHFSGPVIPQDPSLPPTPQRFTFPFRIEFQDDSMFKDNSKFTNGLEVVNLNATLTAAGTTVSSSAQIELTQNPNPFILHGDVKHGYPWYLSVDIRVFQMKAGQTKFAVHLADTGHPKDDATKFIKQAITNLNGSPGSAGAEFDGLPEDEQPSSLALAPKDTGGTSVHNFALARVRYRDVTDATNVRAFFRMWPAQQTNASYDTQTRYRAGVNPSGQRIPLLGVNGDEIITIPFFADTRIDATAANMKTQPDGSNVAKIKHDPLGGEVDTYFGCWLDINQPNDKVFPPRMISGAGTIPDGPFNAGPGQLVSIQELVRSEHQCLLVEISFDPDPIPANADPSTSDKLAQRNLTFVNVPNPGAVASRRVPQTFEIRPTPSDLPHHLPGDELMIEWGNTPPGSTASVYLPAVDPDEVIALADQLYTTHRLTKAGADTIDCPTGGVTYIPVPQGQGSDFAGLMTIDLPATITKGQSYKVTVKQITSAFRPELLQVGARRTQALAERLPVWRRVLGVFQLTIPVGTKTELLGPEERYLSILKWILESIPHESRWYLVFLRYIEQISDRVRFMGGDPGKILPSPDGGDGTTEGGDDHEGHLHHERRGEERIAFAGKVSGLVYGRYGDFEGFLLDTEDGERRFDSREHSIEHVARRAWAERNFTIVIVERDDLGAPQEIILRGAPPPFER